MMKTKIRAKSIEDVIPSLEIGDIILFQSRGTFMRKMIRVFGDSYWTHAALVFDVVKQGDEVLSVILIEANQNVRLHRLESFLLQKDVYRFGVKRIPGLTEQEKERFRGFFLDAIDLKYDFLFGVYFALSTILKKFFGHKAEQFLLSYAGHSRAFVCSTFAQRAFYLAAEPENRRKMLFLGEKASFIKAHGVVLPGDIAKSTNTIWLFNPHR